MNYKKIYDSLIERRKASPLEGYTESHHIIPKCMGGTDNKSNLVKLSAREHFVAHQLLYKIYRTHGLLCAITLMCTDKFGNRLNNRLYGWHRLRFAESSSKHMKEYFKNNPHPKGMLGKHHSDKSKEQVSIANRTSVPSIKIFKFDLAGKFIESFQSIAEAARHVNGNASNLKYCAEGKFQYAYGFRWSYKPDATFAEVKDRAYKGIRGKIWINDGSSCTLIEKGGIIPSGWKRGRILKRKS